MNRELEEFAARMEARAFLYGDPVSFIEGVRAALREVDVTTGKPGRGDARGRRYEATSDGRTAVRR
jgi:hypothetical protein